MKANFPVRMFLVLLPVLVFAQGCGNLDLTLPSKINDFLKTEIIVGGSNLATGTADMYILVHLKNSDSSPVVDYKPQYDITPLAGLSVQACTSSTSAGISVCTIRSTSAGFKTFKLTNAKVGLSKVVEFVNPSSGQVLNLVAGSNPNMTTAAGHKVKLTAGEIGLGTKSTTAGGYKVSVTVKTALDSQ